MAKSKKKQRKKAFKIFEGNAAAQEALKQAFQNKGSSGSKITNKEVHAIRQAGASEHQIKQLVKRVKSSGGTLRIGSNVNTMKDITNMYAAAAAASGGGGASGSGDSGGGDSGAGSDNNQFDFEIPDYSGQINDALAASTEKYNDLLDQMKIDEEARIERERVAEEARRKQMLIGARRERAAGRTPMLQIRGAGETPSTAGTQGFRRRKNQFKKNRRFGSLNPMGGALGAGTEIATGTANQILNI